MTKGSDAGNGQSMYTLFHIHSGNKGQEKRLKDVNKAYKFLLHAIISGVTYFDEIKTFFKENVQALSADFA